VVVVASADKAVVVLAQTILLIMLLQLDMTIKPVVGLIVLEPLCSFRSLTMHKPGILLV
jgi:hypothetical protein